MKVMYLASRNPCPPHKGDQLIAFNQLKNIKKIDKNIKVILAYLTENENDNIDDEVRNACDEIYSIVLPKKITRIMNIGKSIFNFKPMQVNYFTSRSCIREINDIISKEKPDIIHGQTIRTGEYLLEVNNIPKVIDFIDAISLNMKRRSEKELGIKKIIFNIESRLVKQYEQNLISSCNGCFIVSEADKKQLNPDVIVNPNGVDVEMFNFEREIEKENAIIFHGNMGYFPNIRAAKILITEIYPKLKSKVDSVKLYIVGKNPSSDLLKYKSENVIITGYVDDMREYLNKAKVAVFPLDAGTGLQNKVLEAFSAKIPVVVSNYAAAGISNIDNGCYIKANEPDEYVEEIIKLLNSERLSREIAEKAFYSVKNEYSWRRNVKILIETWKSKIVLQNKE